MQSNGRAGREGVVRSWPQRRFQCADPVRPLLNVRRDPAATKKTAPATVSRGKGCEQMAIQAWEFQKVRVSAALAIIVFFAGGERLLAETPSTTYVPPFAYSKYDCPHLVREAHALSARAGALMGVQPPSRGADANINKGDVVLWPRVFSLVGDKNVADELALMRGQMLAIEEASVRSQCSIQFQRPPT
jgi:hypothetical protein